MCRASLRNAQRIVRRGLSLGGIPDVLRPLPRVGGEDPSFRFEPRGIHPAQLRLFPGQARKTTSFVHFCSREVFSSFCIPRAWQTFPEMTVMTKKSPVPVLTNMSKNEMRVRLRRAFCASPVSLSASSGFRQRRHETSLRHSCPQQRLRCRSDSRHGSQP